MKDNKDIKTLITFISLIILILGIFLFNVIKNKKIENIDRKVEYIFDNFTHNNVYEYGNKLFFQAIELLNKKDVFEYEKDGNNKLKYFSIGDIYKYRKIINPIIIIDTFTKTETNKYLELKKIKKFQNNYYRVVYEEEYNDKYIGSIVDIDSYNDKFVYFKSINYYCDNYQYIGDLEEKPNCNYTKTETKYTLILENNNLKIYNLEEIKDILK